MARVGESYRWGEGDVAWWGDFFLRITANILPSIL